MIWRCGVIGVWLGCLSGGLAWGQSAQLALSSASGAAGSTVSLSLSLQAPPAGTSALEWTLSYPAQNIAKISAAASAALTAAGKTLTCTGSTGRYACIAAGLNTAAIQAGIVATISLTLAAGATNSTVTVSEAMGASLSGSAVPLTGVAGALSVSGATSLSLSGLACSPASVTGPGGSVCTVTLNAAAPSGGAAVSLTSSQPVVTLPSTVTISAGATKAAFNAAVGTPTTDQTVTLTAGYNGGSRTASLTVLRPLAVAGLSCSPTVLAPAATSTCTATLNRAAPAGGTAISAASSSTLLAVPSSLTVAAGASSVKFNVTAGNITTKSTATLTAAVTGSSTTPASTTLTLSPAFTPIRINAGGGAYTDATGLLWAGDNSFSGGSGWSTTSSISGTNIPAIYQSGRYGSSFSYQFSVPSGDYTAVLKFAEISQTAAGKRVFNVAINGTAVLSNFDIFAQAGGALIALDKAFPVKVSDGRIAIQFSTGTAGSPLVNGIEILPSSGIAVAISPQQWSLESGQSQQFTAVVTGTTNTAVTWSLSPLIGSISSSGLYVAPPSITQFTAVTVTARSAADPTQSASATLILSPLSTAAFTPIRINAGGPAYTDALGTLWSADSGYSGGALWSTTKVISNTSVPLLYQTIRYGSSFAYQFNVPNAAYSVRLKFAEISQTAVGQRVFNVAINGSTVLANFDIIAQAGAPLTALDKVSPVLVTGGQIRIDFKSGTTNSPLVNAIEIVQEPAFTPIRVNAGGAAYTDTQGRSWSADTGFTAGAVWTGTALITNTSDPTLYQSARYGAHSYQFTVPNGNYQVKLKFAEVTQTAAGKRVFNVALNGIQVLSNFDIFAQAGGPRIALDKSFPVTVTDNQVRLQFLSGLAGNPLINAIEIAP